MEWLERYKFWDAFNGRYRPNKIWLDDQLSVDLRFEHLCNEIPIAPVRNPDDGDEPGPINKWYGNNNGFLFTVKHYDHETKNLTVIECVAKKANDEEYQWSVIKHFP